MELSLSRGNHKSATDNPKLLENLVVDDIKVGFQVPIHISSLKKIKYGVVAHCGIANQLSIDELGERIDKNRLTHDQYFDFSKGNSVNNRLLKKNLPDM